MAKRIYYVKKKNILNLGHIYQKDSLLLLKLYKNVINIFKISCFILSQKKKNILNLGHLDQKHSWLLLKFHNNVLIIKIICFIFSKSILKIYGSCGTYVTYDPKKTSQMLSMEHVKHSVFFERKKVESYSS